MKSILISMGIGVLVSTIACLIIAAAHKPVRTAKTANNYVDKNSINITGRSDHFYDSVVNKTARNNK